MEEAWLITGHAPVIQRNFASLADLVRGEYLNNFSEPWNFDKL